MAEPIVFQDPDGFFRFVVTTKPSEIDVTGTFDTALAGLNTKKLTAVFKLDTHHTQDPSDDTITSFVISDAHHHKLLSYGGFSDPKTVQGDVFGGLTAAFAGGDIYNNLYAFWNGFLSGDFTVHIFDKKGSLTEVGTGGTATITGGQGADIVDIYQSKDVVFNGGKGSDTLYLEARAGVPVEVVGANIDLSQATNANPFGGTLTLKSVENVFGAQGNDIIHGNASNNLLEGGFGGVDSLYGEGGNDTLSFFDLQNVGVADGGDGNDTLMVDISGTNSKLDLTNQANNTGLFAGATVSSIEIFKIRDFGSSFEFHGTDAGETVSGGDGNDILIGNGGNDILWGGEGQDILTGGTGADHFVFKTIADSVPGPADEITDFSHAEHDKIDLRSIDADTHAKGNQAFHFIGSQNFHGKVGELQVVGFTDQNIAIVRGDVNGDGEADFWIRVENLTHLAKGDFLL